MDILILGKSGVGKSNFADMLKNVIFKMDKDAEVLVDDPDRESKQLGSGKNIHKIKVRRIENRDENDMNSCDILIQIKNEKFKQWFEEI